MSNTRKLRFKATELFKAYDGRGVFFRDGDVKEVPENVAEYLLTDFPEYFTEVRTESKSIDEPPQHRMITNEDATTKTTARKRARK